MRLRLALRSLRAPACALAALLVAAMPVAAQPAAATARRVLTAADYHRAEQFMPYNTDPLVLNSGVRATWLWHDPDDRFWYRTRTERGEEFVLVDPVKQTRGPAFDQEKLAAGLSSASGQQVRAVRAPLPHLHVHRRRAVGLVRSEGQALDLQPAELHLHVGGQQGAEERVALARSHEGGLHPRLEPLGARS